MSGEHPAVNVLHVVLSLNPGGAERSVIDIIKRVVRRVPCAVCCLDVAGAWAPELTELGVEVSVLGRPPGFHPSLGLRLAAVADRHRANVLHCHQYTPFVYGQLAALARRRLRVVFTEQGRLSDAPPSPKRRIVNQLLGRLPGLTFAVSENLRQHMIAEGFPPHRVKVIYNAIEPGAVPTAEARAAVRRELGVAEDTVLVGTAARLDPVKDLPTLVEAVSLVRQAGRRAELLIIGDGPERPRIEEAIARTGLDRAAHCVGYRSDVRRLLASVDIYVNCSVSEGISLTILEAMASALPVVATRVGGNPEVVHESVTGLLVPARDPTGLSDALGALSGSEAHRHALGMAGRTRVETLFAVAQMADAYLRAYEQTVRR
jgi:glycosyltransferase involved in cell wall biosynthesis